MGWVMTREQRWKMVSTRSAVEGWYSVVCMALVSTQPPAHLVLPVGRLTALPPLSRVFEVSGSCEADMVVYNVIDLLGLWQTYNGVSVVKRAEVQLSTGQTCVTGEKAHVIKLIEGRRRI